MKRIAIFFLFFFAASDIRLPAQNPANVIPFQGQIADQAGGPLTHVGSAALVFRLYQVPVGGTAVWEEAQPNISINGGRFSVLLGSRTLLPASSYFNSTLYLGITVDDGNPATVGVEMRPRQALVPVLSASYSRHSEDSRRLAGFDWSILFDEKGPSGGKLKESLIGDKSISSRMIQPQAIGSAAIASNSITASQIAPGTITASEIASGSITAKEIRSSSLTLSSLANEVLELLVPPGTIIAFGGHTNTVPVGWLLCDGRGISSIAYPRLFGVLSTNWGSGGGAGSTNDFNLPDLRGMFLRGVSLDRRDGYQDPNISDRRQSIPVDVGVEGRFRGGNRGNAVGSVQVDELKRHVHRIDPRTAIGETGEGRIVSGADAGRDQPIVASTDSEGGDETRPRNAYVHYLVKY